MNYAEQIKARQSAVKAMQSYQVAGYYPLTHVDDEHCALEQIISISSLVSRMIDDDEPPPAEVLNACLGAINVIAALATFSMKHGATV